MDKLITNLAAKFPDLTKADVALSVEIIIDAMSERLINGGRIELRGFGSFCLYTQLQNVRKNLMVETNDLTTKNKLVHFKPGFTIRERANNLISQGED